MTDTIFALSSGPPPAAVAVVRVSGPEAGGALRSLAGGLPTTRRASLRKLRDAAGMVLDEALVLWFSGPNTATGEDLAEFHLHGGRAVADAVLRALGELEGLRVAEPGEFTRRAFANGRIDLAQAEGLADLLEAETEIQRASAVAMAGGSLSRKATAWRESVLHLSALVEAALDFSDEDDVGGLPAGFHEGLQELQGDVGKWLDTAHAETLKEGYRVAIAGPPNAGKSTLFNVLTESEAAITSPHAGTTRDVIERSVALAGIPFTFIDTAGLRDESCDEVELIGIGRAREQMEQADSVLWLGPEGEGPPGSLEVEAQIDCDRHVGKHSPDFRVSALCGDGVAQMREALIERAAAAMPRPGQVALNRRQRALVAGLAGFLAEAGREQDLLLAAEGLRSARTSLDRLVGRTSTEDMLDALFGRFCIGK